MGSCPENHRTFSSVPKLHPLDANSTPAASFDNQYLQRVSDSPWGQNCTLVESHCSEIFCDLSCKLHRKLRIMIAGNPVHLIQDPSWGRFVFFVFFLIPSLSFPTGMTPKWSSVLLAQYACTRLFWWWSSVGWQFGSFQTTAVHLAQAGLHTFPGTPLSPAVQMRLSLLLSLFLNLRFLPVSERGSPKARYILVKVMLAAGKNAPSNLSVLFK